MKFDYFDGLSGCPILVQGVGHLKSPRLKDLQSYTGIGYSTYNLYLNFLSWDKERILQYDRIMGLRGADKLAASETLSTYDVITLLPPTREFCREVLAFFIDESIEWNEVKRKYVVYIADDDEQHITGEIGRHNFDDIRTLMLQLNYIGVEREDVREAKYTDSHSKELWEKAQSFLKKQEENKKKEDKPEYHIGNIISKLCAVHPTYNLFNVWDLTVFQLYDAFFQCGYMRLTNLNEAIFSNHGGDKFAFENWLKPILPNV